MARSIFFYTDSHIVGGAERALMTLVEVLDRSRWAPELLLHPEPGIQPIVNRAAELGIPVRTVPPMPLGGSGIRRIPRFAAGLRRDSPDVFHAHLSSPLAAKNALVGAMLARVPAIVATLHLFGPFEIDRSSRLQLRALAAGVGRYIAVSSDVRAAMIERLALPPQKIDVVRNAVDLGRFAGSAPPGLRAELTVGSPCQIVLTCARLDPQKGLDVLLRAAAEVRQARFVIVGDGPELVSLQDQSRTLGLGDRVVFLGHRDDVPALLAACDVVALPSLYEGTSLAVLEGMAARRAVVSSDIPGTDELILDGDSGLLVPPSDHIALAAAIRRVLNDEGLRTSLALRARERVEREFSLEHLERQVDGIYLQLLDSRSREPRRRRTRA